MWQCGGMTAPESHPTRLERFTTDGGAEVAVLTFAHGPLNLFDQAMFDAVIADVATLTENPPRAVLLRAEGKVNSAGVDVHVFDGLDPEQGAELWRQLFAQICHPLEAFAVPGDLCGARVDADCCIRDLLGLRHHPRGAQGEVRTGSRQWSV